MKLLSIKGLEIGLLGVEKAVGRNWRQWKIKEVTYKTTMHELELKSLAGSSRVFILRYRKLQHI